MTRGPKGLLLAATGRMSILSRADRNWAVHGLERNSAWATVIREVVLNRSQHRRRVDDCFEAFGHDDIDGAVGRADRDIGFRGDSRDVCLDWTVGRREIQHGAGAPDRDRPVDKRDPKRPGYVLDDN